MTGQMSLFGNDAGVGLRGKRVPHPIPYQGSKRSLAPLILPMFPSQVTRLVEPFAGSAAISLAAAFYGRADSFWINDAHGPLIELWKQIIDNASGLSSCYARIWSQQLAKGREYYDVVRKRFNETHKPECFLYLLARCVKAAIRYNSNGEFNNSPDKRRLGATPAEMRKRVTGASALLRGRTAISSLDYREVLESCTTTDLVYMDPPYQGVCGTRDNRYAPKVDHGTFCESLANLNKRGVKYIVSYDGRTGSKVYGEPMPSSLRLVHIELAAGRSSQATLLGRNDTTYESLYLSESLAEQIGFATESPLANRTAKSVFGEASRRHGKAG